MKQTDSALIVQGHRGSRSALPENTIEAFIHATGLGVDFLELDVVCTGDNHILVSHDPYMHHEICATPDGQPISKDEEKSFNIYRMNTPVIQSFKLGTFKHPRFPEQKTIASYKPLLSEMVKAVRQYAAQNKIKEPGFNIELKSETALYGLYQPEPVEYVALFLNEFLPLGIEETSTLQSFDIRILQELNRRAPKLKLVFLSEDQEADPVAQIEELGFIPYGYSPCYRFITENTVRWCTEKNMELIAWTINDSEDMKKMIALGVRNIITDYPELAMQLK